MKIKFFKIFPKRQKESMKSNTKRNKMRRIPTQKKKENIFNKIIEKNFLNLRKEMTIKLQAA